MGKKKVVRKRDYRVGGPRARNKYPTIAQVSFEDADALCKKTGERDMAAVKKGGRKGREGPM